MINAHFEMMANYNAWANERLYRMAGELPDELYRRDAGAFFKSLHGTLNHVLVADRIWMCRLTGTGGHPGKLDATIADTLPELRAERVKQDALIVTFVQELSGPALDGPFDYRTLNGVPQRQPMREILAHLFNHQTHHRGQCHAILTNLGVSDPEPLDLLVMQREKPSTERN